MGTSVERFQDSQWQKLEELNFSKKTVLLLVTSGNVLDIGCGDGILLEYLRGKGINGKGIDISGKAINICKDRGLDCLQADITGQLPFKDSSFENVILTDVLEHIFQPKLLLSEAHRISSKYVLISVPNFVALPARIQVALGRVPENNTPRDGHVYWMTHKVIKSLLEGAGFEIDTFIVNTIWERFPVIGWLTKTIAKVWPSLFGLSFIVKAKKV